MTFFVESKMDYKTLMGYGKKQPNKKVVKEQKKPSVVDTIKQELNEWNDETFKNKPKRWTKPFGGSGLTEHEKLSEGPAYEYANIVKKIEKTENMQAKEVNNLVKVLTKKGLKKEATNLAHSYMTNMREFNSFLKKLMSKLV